MRHKCLASLIVFLLYLTIFAFVGLAELKIIMSSKFLNQVLKSSQIYENLPRLTNLFLKNDRETELQTTIMIKAIAKSIDPLWAQKELEKNMPILIDYLNDRGRLQEVTVDLKSFKKNLSINLPEIMSTELKNLQPCPPDVQPENPQNIPNIPSCLSQKMTPVQIQEKISPDLTTAVFSQIPDTYNLSQIKNPEKKFSAVKIAFKVVKYGFWVMLAINLLLIFCLILLGRGWWPSIPRWVGLSLVLPAGSSLLMTALSSFLPQVLFSGQLSSAGSNPELMQMLQPILEAINRQTQTISYLYAGIIFALGTILIIGSYVLPHPPQAKPTPKATQFTPTR